MLTRLAEHPINCINELLSWRLQPGPATPLAGNDTARLRIDVNRVSTRRLRPKRHEAGGDCSGVRRACHCGFYADGPLINNSEKGGVGFLCISSLSKGPMSPDEGNGPRR